MTMTTVRSNFFPNSVQMAESPQQTGSTYSHLPWRNLQAPDGPGSSPRPGMGILGLWHHLRGRVCPCTLLWCHSSCLCTPEDS